MRTQKQVGIYEVLRPGFRVVRPRGVEVTPLVKNRYGRFEVFEGTGMPRGCFSSPEDAIKHSAGFWGGYVLDRITGDRVGRYFEN